MSWQKSPKPFCPGRLRPHTSRLPSPLVGLRRCAYGLSLARMRTRAIHRATHWARLRPCLGVRLAYGAELLRAPYGAFERRKPLLAPSLLRRPSVGVCCAGVMAGHGQMGVNVLTLGDFSLHEQREVTRGCRGRSAPLVAFVSQTRPKGAQNHSVYERRILVGMSAAKNDAKQLHATAGYRPRHPSWLAAGPRARRRAT